MKAKMKFVIVRSCRVTAHDGAEGVKWERGASAWCGGLGGGRDITRYTVLCRQPHPDINLKERISTCQSEVRFLEDLPWIIP